MLMCRACCCDVPFTGFVVPQARSPVFKALLGGGMREGKEDEVEIQDVRAPVFRALLHFAYTDALPEVSSRSPHFASTWQAQLFSCTELMSLAVPATSTSMQLSAQKHATRGVSC